MREPHILVVGAGLAGLYHALNAASFANVTVITGDEPGSASRRAQGGIAAVLGPPDTTALHVADTLAVGAGLCRQDAVRMSVDSAPAQIRRLSALGVPFDRDRDGRIDRSLEGGHSAHRVAHCHDTTGATVVDVVRAAAGGSSRVVMRTDTVVVELVTECYRAQRPRCRGAVILDAGTGKMEFVEADAVVLATGGSGALYLNSTNAPASIGLGVALALRAGAHAANMEFVQFHPTVLAVEGADGFLLSEALRGEGGVLRRLDGTPLMDGVHPLGSLAPRDIVSRTIAAELAKTEAEHVWLDLTHLDGPRLRARYPAISDALASFGLEIDRDLLPVAPGAHYQCGGVDVDLDARTAVEGLYAIGEVACTGLHGACRLASNSLLEALVFAERAALSIRSGFDAGLQSVGRPTLPSWGADGGTAIGSTIGVRQIMTRNVGVFRSDRALEDAIDQLGALRSGSQAEQPRQLADWANASATLVAELIARAALRRRESRGTHYNVNCPEQSAAAVETHFALTPDQRLVVVALREIS